MNLFFDLDGTLINSRARLYQLFVDLTIENKLNFDEYWRLKRAMFDHNWILQNIYGYKQSQIELFTEEWMSKIETSAYLQIDKLFSFTIPTLEKLKLHTCYVVTARQSYQNTIEELKSLGIIQYFNDCLVTQQMFDKREIIEQKRIDLSPNDIFIGDTGMDVKAGKTLGVKTVAVFCGFRNYEYLEKYSPDYIIKDISFLTKIISFDD